MSVFKTGISKLNYKLKAKTDKNKNTKEMSL